MSKVLIVGMVLLFAGCATGRGGGAAPNADVTGTWTGSYVGISNSSTFTFVAVFQQKGTTVTGNISGAPSAVYNGAIQGTVSGNKLAWKQVAGPGSGDVVVEGHEMNGSWTRAPAAYEGRLTLRRRQ